jgi:hypothetical protein
MSKKGSFLGGHSVLTQRPRDFDAELERDAARAKGRAVREQADFDKQRMKQGSRTLAKIEALDQAMLEAAAKRRAETRGQKPSKIVRAPKTDFRVLKVSRKRLLRPT